MDRRRFLGATGAAALTLAGCGGGGGDDTQTAGTGATPSTTLGGGIGVVDRSYGLTCDRLLSAQVVTADGSIIECDAARDPDLFWALRGGGGATSGSSRPSRSRPIAPRT